MTSEQKENPRVYQVKIVPNGIKPLIWRRIQVPETYSFWDLHVAIQDAMGGRTITFIDSKSLGRRAE